MRFAVPVAEGWWTYTPPFCIGPSCALVASSNVSSGAMSWVYTSISQSSSENSPNSSPFSPSSSLHSSHEPVSLLAKYSKTGPPYYKYVTVTKPRRSMTLMLMMLMTDSCTLVLELAPEKYVWVEVTGVED